MIKKFIIWFAPFIIPFYREYKAYKKFNAPNAKYRKFLKFKLGFSKLYWEVDDTCIVANGNRIFVGKQSRPGRPFSYINGEGGVVIGDYVRFGPNIGIISTNHDIYNLENSISKQIIIEDYSWIGMGATILAGVHLGPCTIVGANAVVTKSFPDGYCVIGGNPARLIKRIDKERVVRHKVEREFYGFIPANMFSKFRGKYIKI